MKVSIITLCRDTPEHMKKCFDSVMTFTEGIGFDIEWIVIDNDSHRSDMASYFNYIEKYPGVQVIHNNDNRSFAQANNQAAEMATGECLVFMNSDIVVTKDWLKNMIDCMKRHDAVAVGARLYFPFSETIQHAGITQREDKIFTHRFYKEQATVHPEIMTEEEMPVTAALMMIRKDVFDEVNGFDERYNWGYEDVDLNLKLIVRDHKIMYCPSCFAYHHEHGTDQNINKDLGDNIKKLIEKWKIK